MELCNFKGYKLTSDVEENTKLLFEIPGLSEGITLTLGNAFFIPKSKEDRDKPWRKFTVNIDGEDCLFFTTHTEKPKTVFPYPVLAFSPRGIRKIFENSPPPPEFDVFLIKYLEEIYGNNIECKKDNLLNNTINETL